MMLKSDALRIAFVCPFIARGRGGMESVGAFAVNSMVKRGHEAMLIYYDAAQPCYDIDPRVQLVPGMEDESFVEQVREFSPHVYYIMSSDYRVIDFVRQGLATGSPIALQECTNHIRYCGNNWARLRKISHGRAYWERELVNSCAVRIRHVLPHSTESHPDYIASQVRIFPNACDFPKVDRVDFSLREKLILNVGGLRQIKNILPVLEGFTLFEQEHPGWTFAICGTGYDREEDYQQRVHATIKELRLLDKVEFVGEVSDMAAMYDRATMHVSGSLSENYGMCIVEACHRGVPSVVFENSFGASSLVEHEVNGLQVPQEEGAQGVCAAFTRLADDRELLERLSLAACKDERFTPGVCAQNWEQFFQECAAYKHAPGRLQAEQAAINPERSRHARRCRQSLLGLRFKHEGATAG